MAAREGRTAPPSTWVATAAVVGIALAVGLLAIMAYDRVNPSGTPGAAAPVPTFTLGVRTATPKPADTAPTGPAPPAAPALIPRHDERFLAAGSGAIWRATAGACARRAPVVERSTDGGASWTDTTPGYRGIAQVESLDSFAGTEAEMVVGVGGGCETQVLRTYTRGEFWESFPEVLAASRYLDVFDSSVLHSPRGTMTVPCADARGLRATGAIVAVICDGAAYAQRDGGTWTALPGDGAAAVAVASGTAWVAHTAADCDGLRITRFDGADPTAGAPVACVPGASSPVALAASTTGLYLWFGDEVAAVMP